MYRVQTELCLVEILQRVRQNGQFWTKEELLEDLAHHLESERALINVLGRREAAKVYGWHEATSSSMDTVDFILREDLVAYYRELKT